MLKIHDFFRLCLPVVPSTTIPSIQAGPEAWYPGGGIFGWTWGRITTSQEKSNKSQLEIKKNLQSFWLSAFGYWLSAFGYRLSAFGLGRTWLERAFLKNLQFLDFSPKKKIVRNFLKNLIFLIFFEFFTKHALIIFLRGREIIIKKYWVFYEIWANKK